MPSSVAASRSEPSRVRAWIETGAPNAPRALPGPLVVEVGANLRVVRPHVGAAVEVDPVLARLDDLGHEQVRDTRGQRAARRAGKGAVEVATVRQVALPGHEAELVDDRDGDQRPGELLGPDLLQQPADRLDAVDLVAVDRRADEQRRARAGGRAGRPSGSRSKDRSRAARRGSRSPPARRAGPRGRRSRTAR